MGKFKGKPLYSLRDRLQSGKYAGMKVIDLINNHYDYYRWVVENNVYEFERSVHMYANRPLHERLPTYFIAEVTLPNGRIIQHKLFVDSMDAAAAMADSMIDKTKIQNLNIYEHEQKEASPSVGDNTES